MVGTPYIVAQRINEQQERQVERGIGLPKVCSIHCSIPVRGLERQAKGVFYTLFDSL